MPNQTDRRSGSADQTIIRAVAVRHLGGHRLWIKFSNGTSGVRAFSSIASKTGSMVAPLRDVAVFSEVSVEDGTLTWPNGYDLDTIHLHMKMHAADELALDAAE
jgi:Protein of unknown function (DUF2442)